MKTKLILIVGVALLFQASVFAGAHTPKAGSEERTAICDALRVYVVGKLAMRPLPQPIVFRVDVMRVDGDVAWFSGIPMLKSGGYATDYLPDMDYVMVLKRAGGGWRVVNNLSRSDVPAEAEAAALRKQLAWVPSSVIPDSWRQTLKR